MSADQTLTRLQALAEGTKEVARTYPNVHLAAPAAGAIPIARLLLKQGLPKDALDIVEVSGRIGTDVIGTAVLAPLPEKVTDPKRTLFLVEDVADTLLVASIILTARKEARLKAESKSFNAPEWNEFIKSLTKLPHDTPGSNPLLVRFAKECAGENMHIIAFVNKNQGAFEAIRELALATSDTQIDNPNIRDWQKCEQELEARIPAWYAGKRWIMGAFMLDVSFELGVVLDRAQKILESNPGLLNQFNSRPVAIFPLSRAVTTQVG